VLTFSEFADTLKIFVGDIGLQVLDMLRTNGNMVRQ
jgi:hypothetical protein